MARLASALAVAAFVGVAVQHGGARGAVHEPRQPRLPGVGARSCAPARLPTAENALTTPHPVPIVLMAAVGGIVSPLATWAALAICGLVAVRARRHAGRVARGRGIRRGRSAAGAVAGRRDLDGRAPPRHRLAGGGRHRPGARGAARAEPRPAGVPGPGRARPARGVAAAAAAGARRRPPPRARRDRLGPRRARAVVAVRRPAARRPAARVPPHRRAGGHRRARPGPGRRRSGW